MRDHKGDLPGGERAERVHIVQLAASLRENRIHLLTAEKEPDRLAGAKAPRDRPAIRTAVFFCRHQHQTAAPDRCCSSVDQRGSEPAVPQTR